MAMSEERCPHCDRRMPARFDGRKFGRWTVVLDRVKRSPGKTLGWMALCRCECGVEREVMRAALVDGSSKGCRSCGQKGRWYRERKGKRHG